MAAGTRLIDLPPISTVRLTEHWHVSKDGDPAGLSLYERHYSCKTGSRGIAQFVGPGEKLVLLTEGGDALWVWRRFIENQNEEPVGVNCAVFRNEGSVKSMLLVREAERVALCRWPREEMYTFVDPTKVEAKDRPGECFLRAGWKHKGYTKGGLMIFRKSHSWGRKAKSAAPAI